MRCARRPRQIELRKALKGANYPAGRSGLVECAEGNGAGDDPVQQFPGLDTDRFDGPDDAEKAVFGRK